MGKVALNAFMSKVSGKVGTAVFADTKEGIVLKQWVSPSNPSTPAQVAVRANLSKVTKLFKNFSPPQNAAWKAYAQTWNETSETTGKVFNLSAISAFVKLGTKFLQVNPTGTVPTTPPFTAFTGDTVTVTTAGGTGVITFTASGANATNVKTELLIQKLNSLNCVPSSNGYRSKGFFAFTAGSLTTTVTLPGGVYASGYRFVNTVTGQETAVVPLSIVPLLAVTAGGKGKDVEKAA
jgi:hypothetical protein